MRTYYIKTFGCQANKSDSERIAGDYSSRGYSSVRSWREADEIIINTCAVRQRAEDRVLGFLNLIEKHFAGSQKPKIILTGCMLHHGGENLRKKLPLIDEILPIGEVGFNTPSIRQDKTHAWVSVSTGCNSFCSYCIVPYARGREHSRPIEDIISEISELADHGYDEVTLLGQNVNSYGLEDISIATRKQTILDQHAGQPPFVVLLREVSKIKNIKKINFMTSNPWDFWDQLIDEIAANPKIDRFIHLPIQSGSNHILKLMNRGYTREDYLALIEKIRSKVPDVVFGTDIIVGFPTETDDDFQDTFDLAKEVGFKLAFVAQYSPRPGTVAAKLYSDDITPKIKKTRWLLLEKLINRPHLNDRPEVKK